MQHCSDVIVLSLSAILTDFAGALSGASAAERVALNAQFAMLGAAVTDLASEEDLPAPAPGPVDDALMRDDEEVCLPSRRLARA